jgi:hypothetical protein
MKDSNKSDHLLKMLTFLHTLSPQSFPTPCPVSPTPTETKTALCPTNHSSSGCKAIHGYGILSPYKRFPLSCLTCRAAASGSSGRSPAFLWMRGELFAERMTTLQIAAAESASASHRIASRLHRGAGHQMPFNEGALLN